MSASSLPGRPGPNVGEDEPFHAVTATERPGPNARTEGVIRVPLTKGHFAIIDAADAALVSPYAWAARRNKTPRAVCFYAYRTVKRNGKTTTQSMHQLIMGGIFIDHVNGNGLDNRRSNLRFATKSQNMGNTRKTRGTSRFKGVAWRPAKGKWVARIMVDRKETYLGYFADEAEAAEAYDRAARQGFGEFAALNFPGDGERSALLSVSIAAMEAVAMIPKPAEKRARECSEGHKYTQLNTYIRPNGRRECRECRRCRTQQARISATRRRAGDANGA